MMNKISWWRTNFGDDEIEHVVHSMQNKNISQGPVTKEFEKSLSDLI